MLRELIFGLLEMRFEMKIAKLNAKTAELELKAPEAKIKKLCKLTEAGSAEGCSALCPSESPCTYDTERNARSVISTTGLPTASRG